MFAFLFFYRYILCMSDEKYTKEQSQESSNDSGSKRERDEKIAVIAKRIFERTGPLDIELAEEELKLLNMGEKQMKNIIIIIKKLSKKEGLNPIEQFYYSSVMGDEETAQNVHDNMTKDSFGTKD